MKYSELYELYKISYTEQTEVTAQTEQTEQTELTELTELTEMKCNNCIKWNLKTYDSLNWSINQLINRNPMGFPRAGSYPSGCAMERALTH